MASNWKILGLLLHKNLIVRKRYWHTAFVQALIPIVIIALVQAVFNKKPPIVTKIVNESIHYSAKTQDELIEKLDNDLNNIYYLPKNKYTNKIMKSARNCLQFLPESKYYLKQCLLIEKSFIIVFLFFRHDRFF